MIVGSSYELNNNYLNSVQNMDFKKLYLKETFSYFCLNKMKLKKINYVGKPKW